MLKLTADNFETLYNQESKMEIEFTFEADREEDIWAVINTLRKNMLEYSDNSDYGKQYSFTGVIGPIDVDKDVLEGWELYLARKAQRHDCVLHELDIAFL